MKRALILLCLGIGMPMLGCGGEADKSITLPEENKPPPPPQLSSQKNDQKELPSAPKGGK